MDIKRDIKDICETLRDEELYTEAMAIEEIIKVQNSRIQELTEENEKLDVECTKRQLEIYRLRKALGLLRKEVDKVIAEKDLALKETHKIAYEIQPQENARLRKALEFYAEISRYEKTPARSLTLTRCPNCGHKRSEQDWYEADIIMDQGVVAIEALKSLNKGEKVNSKYTNRDKNKPKRGKMDKCYVYNEDIWPFNTLEHVRIPMYKADEVNADKAKDTKRIQELVEEKRTMIKQLEELTPRGSEFYQDFDACLSWIKQRLSGQKELFKSIHRLRKMLENMWERMDRAREILCDQDGGNWGMLDTTSDRKAPKEGGAKNISLNL